MTARTGRGNSEETLRLKHLAPTAAVGTSDRLRARLSARALALRAYFLAADIKSLRDALGRFKQIQFDLHAQVATGSRTSTRPATKQVAKHAAAKDVAKR